MRMKAAFIFAVGADLTAVPAAREREQAVEIARAGHTVFAAIMDLPVPTFAFVNGAAMGGGLWHWDRSSWGNERLLASIPSVSYR